MARRATKPRASRPVLALEREKVSLASMVWEIPTLRRLILSHLDTTAFKQCMLLNRATRADGLAERFRTLRRPWQARKSRRKGKYAGQTIPNDLELSEREIKVGVDSTPSSSDDTVSSTRRPVCQVHHTRRRPHQWRHQLSPRPRRSRCLPDTQPGPA